MSRYRIEIDREACIGDELCCLEAGNTFEMDDEAKAVVADQDGDPDDCIECAAENCPAAAISLFDLDTGDKVYPED